MNRPARTALRVATLVAVAFAALACGGSSAPDATGEPELQKVTVVLDWTPNTNHAGVYLAQARGWYRKAGIDLKIIEPGDAGALQLLASGKADVAFSPQEELIPARAKGVPVVAIAAVVQHNTSSLLSLSSGGIASPADLPGHTYGGYGGPLEKALVEKLVTCAGGDPRKVKFAEVGDVDYRVGLEKHQYDFVWIYDGWDKIRLADLEHVKVATIPFSANTTCIPDWYTPMLATTEKELKAEPALLKRFTEVTKHGYQAAMANPKGAAEALTNAVPELDPALVARSAEYLSTRYSDKIADWGVQDPAVWRGFVAFLVEAGLIDKPIEVDAAFTNALLPGAGGS